MKETIIEEFNFGNFDDRVKVVNHFTCAHFKVNTGQATVVGIRIKDKLYYSVSICSPLDNFSKKKGRMFARNFFLNDTQSNKRGVLNIGAQFASTPAQLFKRALEKHLEKMRNKPMWLKNVTVEFRNDKQNI
jgi:hypothetical protein